jgi:Family of unknown function (DUF5681)
VARFQPGQSGNPAGPRTGSKHRVTLALEKLLDGEARAITRKAVELAKAGDTVALKLCLERILPMRRGRPISFKLPTLGTPSDLVAALSSIAAAVATGELTIEEGQGIAAMLEGQRRAIETIELTRQVEELKQEVALMRARDANES